MDGMDELRSPSLPTSPAAPIIVFLLSSMLSVLQLLGTIRCPEKPRAAHVDAARPCHPVRARARAAWGRAGHRARALLGDHGGGLACPASARPRAQPCSALGLLLPDRPD